MDRPKHVRKKDVTLICDVPVLKEIEDNRPYSSQSSLSLFLSLRTGKITPACPDNKDFEGIPQTDIFPTYLDYSYFGRDVGIDKNTKYEKEVKKKQDLASITVEGLGDFLVLKDQTTLTKETIEKHTFYKLPQHKDVYVSYRLKQEIDSTIEEIRKAESKIIVLTGKWSLLFLTDVATIATTQGSYKDPKILGSLKTYRGSCLRFPECFKLHESVVVPVYHTLSVMSMPDTLFFCQMDYEKIAYMHQTLKEEPISHFFPQEAKHTFSYDAKEVVAKIEALTPAKKTPIAFDIETMYSEVIDCIGIASSEEEGFCIAFSDKDTPNLMSEEDEVEVMIALLGLMSNENVLHIGQNYSYDCQYYRRFWLWECPPYHDTMIMAHCLYNNRPKDLATLASLYCEAYTYWKEERTKDSPETRWKYCAKDARYTLEIYNVLSDLIDQDASDKLKEFIKFQQEELAYTMDRVMARGVRVDIETKEEMREKFQTILDMVVEKLKEMVGEPDWNVNSSPQKVKILKDLLGITLQKKKGTGSETCEKEAMTEYIQDYPLVAPFLTLLKEHGSLKTFVSTFLNMKLDTDSRARTQYKVSGTDTFRLASVKNAFESGGNFQNIPEKGKIDLEFTEKVYLGRSTGEIQLPNCKTMFIPDEGYIFFNADFVGADAQVVAFDSNCPFLIDIFLDDGKDLYATMASEYYRRPIKKKDKERTTFKAVAHATAYLGKSPTISRAAGLLVHEVDKVQRWYFARCPEVKVWQNEIINDIETKGYTENIFGARGWYTNHRDPTWRNKAVAWRGQSVIAGLCNKAMVTLNKADKDILPLLNIHDAVAGQFKSGRKDALSIIKNSMCHELQYRTPRTIEIDLDVYMKGYGSQKYTISQLESLGYQL